MDLHLHLIHDMMKKIETCKLDSIGLTSEHFSGAKTDEDFIKIALKKYVEEQDKLPKLDPKKAKCDETAKWLLNKVRTNASLMTLEEQVETYNGAMILASPESEFLGHAFANRSIVLSNAGMYEESLKDIENALKTNYPDSMKALLFVRKAKNLCALNSKADIEEPLAKARQWALKMNEKEKNKLLTNLDKLKHKKYKKPVKEHDNRVFVPSSPNDNTLIKNTSSAITVNYSQKFGRHVVATKDMKAGEVISVKQAYTLVISCEDRSKRCWNCSKRTWSSVPCNSCSNVIFCDEECRDNAWKDHHDLECSIFNGIVTLANCYEDINLMSVRLFVKAIKEFGTVKALYESVQKMNSTEDLIMKNFAEKTYDETQYASIYLLCRKSMDKKFQVQSAHTALQIMRCIALTSKIFGKKMEDMTQLENYEYAAFVGKLLYHHIAISHTNMNPIYARGPVSDVPVCGGMLQPFLSLFNHSCDPNANTFLSRGTSVLMTVQPVKKGDQLFICYGGQYHNTPTLKRREELQKTQNFRCDCLACLNNWNPGHDFPSCFRKLPRNIGPQVTRFLMETTHKFFETNFFDCGTASPEEVKDLMSRSFSVLNLMGDFDVYPCEEISIAKCFLYGSFRWITGYQS